MNDVILRYFVYFNLMLLVNECGLITSLLFLARGKLYREEMFPVMGFSAEGRGKTKIGGIGNREIIVKMQHVNLNVISKAIFII